MAEQPSTRLRSSDALFAFESDLTIVSWNPGRSRANRHPRRRSARAELLGSAPRRGRAWKPHLSPWLCDGAPCSRRPLDSFPVPARQRARGEATRGSVHARDGRGGSPALRPSPRPLPRGDAAAGSPSRPNTPPAGGAAASRRRRRGQRNRIPSRARRGHGQKPHPGDPRRARNTLTTRGRRKGPPPSLPQKPLDQRLRRAGARLRTRA
jgi:hypothetical protein